MGVGFQKAVFLDRDGVLNELVDDRPPITLAALKIPKDVLPNLLRLRQAGYMLFCVTNQPDIARRRISRYFVERINEHLYGALPISKLYMCPHDDHDNCQCRKPKAGMLLQAAKEYGVDLAHSFMIGDRAKDIVAGRTAGCRVLLMAQGEPPIGIDADATVSNMKEAVDWILGWKEKS